MSKTKIDIISGFLGAGKTTLIKSLLEAIKGEQVVLIENEFGEIGIDGGFLKEAGIQIKEMNSGCICCSLVGDFASSLKEILSTYKPDRVIIEPSGVGKLSDVMKAVADVEKDLNVESNSSVTVVDVKKCKMYMKNFGEFFNNQIEYANTIILSRTDVADEKTINKAIELIREVNKEATIVTTPVSNLSETKLLETLEKPIDLKVSLLKEYEEHHHEHHHHHEHGEDCGCGHEHHHHHEHGEDCGCGHEHHHHHEHGEDCGCGHEHHHHHADEVFTSWGLENVNSITREKLEDILDKFAQSTEYGIVLRAKGMIKDSQSDKWFYFDLVPEETQIRFGEPESSGKVCVIGVNLKEDKLVGEFRA